MCAEQFASLIFTVLPRGGGDLALPPPPTAKLHENKIHVEISRDTVQKFIVSLKLAIHGAALLLATVVDNNIASD